jgi:hypothetical protein
VTVEIEHVLHVTINDTVDKSCIGLNT